MLSMIGTLEIKFCTKLIQLVRGEINGEMTIEYENISASIFD